jgi:hypothetical protein
VRAAFVVEHHASFTAASKRAKALATQLACVAIVLRSESGWVIRAAGTHKAFAEDEGDSLSDGVSAVYEEYEREVRQAHVQEMNDYQDGWARSEEDGWFYED